MRFLENLNARVKTIVKQKLFHATLRSAGPECFSNRSIELSKGQFYLAYQPDSFCVFHTHMEYAELLAGFTAHNLPNNGGDIPRLWSLMLNIKQIIKEGIAGDFAELGVWRGNTAAVLAHYAEMSQRELFLFDTYEGFSKEDFVGVDLGMKPAYADTSLDMVKSVVGVNRGCCHYVQGHFPGTISDDHRRRTYAAVSLDCDLYEPMKAGLDFFYPRLSKGGIFLLHDYSSCCWEGARKAIDEFCSATGEFLVLLPDKSGSTFLRRSK